MKKLFFFPLFLITYFLSAQNKGLISYQDVNSRTKNMEIIKKRGVIIRIQPQLVYVQSIPKVNKLLEDYKEYMKTWYRIKSIKFLDNKQFSKLDTVGMRVQTLCYIQYKNRDYKWDGCRYFKIFEVSSKIYFNPFIKEYSDRFEMEILVAEQFN